MGIRIKSILLKHGLFFTAVKMLCTYGYECDIAQQIRDDSNMPIQYRKRRYGLAQKS